VNLPKDGKAIRAEVARIEAAIAAAEADVRSRTTAGTIYPYWEKPLPDVSRLQGFRDGLKWALE